MKTVKRHKHISSFQVIILGFLSLILLSTLLLMLPFATASGEGASFMEALFTSTSAVCVTGLIVQDTATYWSVFGQAIIIIMIQIGGMGVVTIAMAITVVSGKKISLMQRSTMQEAISAPQVGGIVRITKFILITSLCIELIGALAMSPVFCAEYGIIKGIWYSIFHSVSAFCNAGFDLCGVKEKFSSLTSYSLSPIINITVMLLIITGGIGFFVWNDIRQNKHHISKYRMQSKVVLSVTAGLIIIPALGFFIFEYTEGNIADRLMLSFFQSVTSRTAGFNTADLTLLSEVGKLFFIMLMLIGGSPGSTAGGMKTTTVAVLFASAFSVFRKKEQAVFFKRRVPSEAVRNAATIFLMYLVLFITGGMIISRVDSVPLMSALFETASAIATVGLSFGITPQLSDISHIILILLMFFGRVGGLTIIFAAVSERRTEDMRYPEEKITVG